MTMVKWGLLPKLWIYGLTIIGFQIRVVEKNVSRAFFPLGRLIFCVTVVQNDELQ